MMFIFESLILLSLVILSNYVFYQIGRDKGFNKGLDKAKNIYNEIKDKEEI